MLFKTKSAFNNIKLILKPFLLKSKVKLKIVYYYKVLVKIGIVTSRDGPGNCKHY